MSLEATKTAARETTELGGMFSEEAQTTYSICRACMGYDTCTFPMNLGRPILHCAEFKPYPSHETAQASEAVVEPAETSEKSDETQYVGLCRNCELREECAYVEPGKFVLNCEEYC